MKLANVIIAALLISFSSIEARSQSTEQVLGAIAGGALGSTIGDGDGQKAATVIGAIIGYSLSKLLSYHQSETPQSNADYQQSAY